MEKIKYGKFIFATTTMLFSLGVYANEKFERIGIIQAEDVRTISSNISGQVIDYFAEIGEEVSESKLLVKINDENIKIEKEIAQSNLEQSILYESYNQKKVNKYKELREKNNLSESDYDDIVYEWKKSKNDIKIKEMELKNIEKNLAYTSIYGFDDYYVSKKFVNKGDYIQASSSLYELVKINKLKVHVLLEESVIRDVSIGDKVFVYIDKNEIEEKKLNGVIKNIGITMEDSTYAYPVIIEINNKNLDIPISKTVEVSFLKKENGKIE